MKRSIMKKLALITVMVCISINLYSFEKGWVFGLRADFGGSLTLPEISDSTLEFLNPKAQSMSGFLSGLLIGGEASVGYIFNSQELFSLNDTHSFSGIGLYGYIGMGMGNVSQKITAVEAGELFDIFIVVDYTPVVNFGVKTNALFFNNRLSVGLGIGGKAILDYTPQYLLYSTLPDVIKTEIGTVIVPNDLLTKLNPLGFSVRFELGYAIPMLPTTEFVLGFYTQYNLYSPRYLTIPPTLESLAQSNAIPPDSLDFSREFPDYWLNSLEFGVNIGISLIL